MHGTVMRVLAGAAQVQWVLDDAMHQLVVIEWYASWVDTCKAAAAEINNMARRYPDMAFLRLDVTDGSANTAFALEKVLTAPEARRRGARPMLRGGARWPCFTLHDYALQPVAQLTGAGAVKDLEAAVRERSAGPVELTAAQDAELERRQRAHWAAGDLPDDAGKDTDTAAGSKTATPAQQQQQLPRVDVRRLSEGATDLKALLADARAAGTTALVLWTESRAAAAAANEGSRIAAAAGRTSGVGSPEAAGSSAGAGGSGTAADSNTSASLPAESAAGAAGKGGGGAPAVDVLALLGVAAAALGEPTVTAGHIDIATSKANRVLAGALKVTKLPMCHMYRDMALVCKTSAAEPDELAAALAKLRVNAGAGAAADASLAAGSGSASAAAGPPAAAAAAPAAQAPEPSIWDPPVGKFARSGAVRQFDKGLGQLYPKMPCLRCGCPWWLGDGWDAACARCGWDCEKDGYDDDSQPLPRFRAKWEAFCAHIRAGHTPHWAK